MEKFILSISNGSYDLPIGLAKNTTVDWQNYQYQTIKPIHLNKLKQIILDDKKYLPLLDILKQGFEIRIWRLKTDLKKNPKN